MAIPEVDPWLDLTPADKRERIIAAAISVFARAGLEAAMHEVASAAGAGVASIYRIFPSKHDLWAAIVVRRMDELTDACETARAQIGTRWEALEWFVRTHVQEQSPEPFTVEARDAVSDVPEVADAVARATAAQTRLIDDARAEGRLRVDATVLDLRLVFVATRAARRSPRADVGRMLELMLDALQAGPSAGPTR